MAKRNKMPLIYSPLTTEGDILLMETRPLSPEIERLISLNTDDANKQLVELDSNENYNRLNI